MAYASQYKEYPLAFLVLFFVSSDLFNGIRANKLAVINHEVCRSCPRERVSSLKDVPTYSELKYDPRASLPPSFTICVSVFVARDNFE